LRLRPTAPTTGHVDGAWWPRSQDLAAELPALLAVPAVRLGEIQQRKCEEMTTPTYVSLYERRLKLDTLTEHSELSAKSAQAAAVRVLGALDHIPERVR
jgi:hypothetical protein